MTRTDSDGKPALDPPAFGDRADSKGRPDPESEPGPSRGPGEEPSLGESRNKFNDAMATLKLYVDLANSERQVIWARNAAMLVSNSFIVNALNSEIAKSDPTLNLAFSIGGFFICCIWMAMNWSGWTWFNKTLMDGAKLPLPVVNNPLAQFKIAGRWDTIFTCVTLLIVVFAFVYVLSAIVFWPKVFPTPA